ncbi:CsbD family protein [Paraburkholderia lacunae]|uniref:CsbD family protein n=1 Tax=Paraburkholderia lacunae TaxID=2211104 RepID=UPI001FCA55A9|nr:CsbD family protein [Paraburkholderia lacunae]
METTKTEGALRGAAGAVQETIGTLTGDAGAQIAGSAKELRGKAQQPSADATSLARDKDKDNGQSARRPRRRGCARVRAGRAMVIQSMRFPRQRHAGAPGETARGSARHARPRNHRVAESRE